MQIFLKYRLQYYFEAKNSLGQVQIFNPFYRSRNIFDILGAVVNKRGCSDDAVEGVKSFFERRPANFTDPVSSLPDVFPDWVDPQF